MASMQVWTYRNVPSGIELQDFEVEARDGSIGTIDKATAQAGDSYLVVDTGPWIFGKKVLLPAGIVDRIDAGEEKVFVNRSRDEIKNAPEFQDDLGVTEGYRQQVGSYYAARTIGESRPESRRAPRRRQASRARQSKRSAPQRGKARTRSSDEPTRDELYERAKRLGIEGRSKMNKAQLKRAVARKSGQSGGTKRRSSATRPSRRSTSSRGKANPVEVQTFLEGVSYPTRKGDLLREAERQGASRTVRSTLQRLPDERFEDPTEVSEAVSRAR
jgi:hypothetical protein